MSHGLLHIQEVRNERAASCIGTFSCTRGKTCAWLPSNIYLALSVLLPILLHVPAVRAQWHVGAHAAVGAAWHKTRQDVLALENDCGYFTYGRGNGYSAGLLGEIDAAPWLRGSLRLTWAQLGGTFKTICDNGIIVPGGGDNDFVPLVREYTKTIRLDYGLAEIGLKVVPFPIPFYLSAGLSIGAPIFQADYAQEERIVSPEGVLFPGYTTRRSNGSGDIADSRLRSAVLGGIGYTFPLRGQVELSPELVYTHPLGNTNGSYDWTIQHARFGVSLTWALNASDPPTVPATVPPTTPLPPPVQQAAPPVARIGTASDAEVRITETFVTETFPLLPYVFFEKGESSLPAKYISEATDVSVSFSESALPRKTLQIYYRVLDILGHRLRANPMATVTLIGSTDDKLEEKGDTALAMARARVIRTYLSSRWGIDETRLRTTTQRLPPIPTSQVYAEGDEENRRVDLVASTPDLFRPVIHERFSEYDITPPTIEMTLEANAVAAVTQWAVTVRQGSTIVAEFGGEGAPPGQLQWRLNDSVAAQVQDGAALIAVLHVQDLNGSTGSSEISLPVSKKQNSFEVGRLSLIVFDFDRSDILPQNQRMIERFVVDAIKPKSSIRITGSTDRLGESAYNTELSAARAVKVKALLLSQNPSYSQIESRGIGEAPELYDNDLPEGRFYCRTVSVLVETPVGK